MPKRFAIALVAAAVGVLALGAQSAAAATIEVTETSDSGAGSLRKAIARANRLPGPDTIAITATGTISLVSRLPDLSTDLAIDGPGARRLTIDGHGLAFSTFRVYPEGGTVTLSRISIVGGGGAAGINNSGTLTLSHSAVRDARIVGIQNMGDATLTDSVVLHNGRGGIDNYEGTLAVLRSKVAQNTGIGITQNQAASAAKDASTTVRESTVSGNSGPGYPINGGGISINRGTLTVLSSTLSGNSAYSGGAIVASNGARITVLQSTLSGNSASGPQSWGGGIFNYGATVTVAQSTLSGNSAYAGGGIFDLGAQTTLRSTIVADSVGANCVGAFGGVAVSHGYNLADDTSCNLTAAGDQPKTEPWLKPLDSYGGPTETHALRPISAAVDAGVAGIVPTDQRGLPGNVNYPGVPKPFSGDNADVGSFELQAP
jgi:hypothetical protein